MNDSILEKAVENIISAPAVVLDKTISGSQSIATSIMNHEPVKKAGDYWERLGPGLTTGAADDDPSGVATYSQAGAQFGFQLIWLAPFTFPLMAIVQEMCARIGLVTGRGLAGNIRIHYSRWILYLCSMLLFITNTFNIGVDIGAMAKAVQLIIPNANFVLILIIFTSISLGLQIFITYDKYAKYLKFLALLLLSYVFSALYINMDWGMVIKNAVIPSIVFSKDQFFLICAILGTTISPYLFFWQTSQEVEEEILNGKTYSRRHVATKTVQKIVGKARDYTGEDGVPLIDWMHDAGYDVKPRKTVNEAGEKVVDYGPAMHRVAEHAGLDVEDVANKMMDPELLKDIKSLTPKYTAPDSEGKVAKAFKSVMSWWKGGTLAFPAIQTGGPDWTNPVNYTIRPDSQLITYSAPAQRWGGKADLENAFATTYPLTLKVGVKQAGFYQKANRDLNYYTYAGKPTTPANGGITPWLGYNMSMSGGRYGPFPFPQFPQTGLAGDVWADPKNWTQTAADVWNTLYNSRVNDAEFDETINSAYVQGSLKLHRLRLTTGLRVEATETHGTNLIRVSNTTNSNLATASIAANAARALDNFRGKATAGTKYNNTFPGLHLVYDLGHNTQARASYSRSITRPTPTTLLPNIVPNETNQTLTAGNPNLRPYTSDNFDISVAKYFSGIGQLSAGVFQKQITNYFRTFQGTVPTGDDNGFGGDYAGWTLTQNRNVGSARIRGIELNHQQQYTFLPGFLRGLGSFANFTYLDTQGDYGSIAVTRRLPNLTPRSANAGLTWRGHGFDVRVMMNYRSEFYRSSTSGTFGSGAGVLPGTMFYDIYQHARTLWDTKIQYNLNRTYSVYFDIYNLTNDWTNNDYLHAFGREIPSYAAGAGTSFKLGLTARL